MFNLLNIFNSLLLNNKMIFRSYEIIFITLSVRNGSSNYFRNYLYLKFKIFIIFIDIVQEFMKIIYL